VSKLVVMSDDLGDALGRVLHAVAPDETRPILSTVLFEGDERGFRLVAADNYRLAIATVTDEACDLGRVPVARSEIAMLRAFLGAYRGDREIAIEFREGPDFAGMAKTPANRLRLAISDAYRSVSLLVIDGTYPNYAEIVSVAKRREKVAVNPSYVVDAARALSKNAPTGMRIEIPINPKDPVLVAATDYVEYIMPIRITG